MKSVSLGKLEQQIMDIVWESKNCSARDVLTQFDQENQEKNLAYTTIATILQRLYDKGLLARKETSAGYIYSPKVSREKYTKNVANSFLKNFINSFGDTAIASFADSIDKLPEKKRKYFLTLLEEHGQNK
jgi:predicted transcriptional regulator